MPREDAASKARRYLLEGRLVVELVRADEVAAVVRGDGAQHRVTFFRNRWRCTCPSRGRCSHQLAVGLVVAPRQEP
jgi:uncharacterized Zn finger protein